MSRLDIDSGETYTIGSGETEEWAGADVEGSLDVDGTLKLIDDPDIPGEPQGFDVDTNPLDLPTTVNLPMGSLNLSTMQEGVAIFLFGTWALLLGASAFFKNYAAGILLFFAVMAALFSGLMGIGLEVHWVLIIATLFTLAGGMVVRWMQ